VGKIGVLRAGAGVAPLPTEHQLAESYPAPPLTEKVARFSSADWF
jgi:hypothetical protein